MVSRATTLNNVKRRVSSAPPKARNLSRAPADPTRVELVRIKGTKGRGGGPDGEAWRIALDGKRCGTVFINLIDEPPIGKHASLQIYLNKSSQGRKIGRLGYARAAALSKYDVIYAHMQKANIASARAAEEAGFVELDPSAHRQKVMVWRRNASTQE